jgi:hypothetical protein
VNLHRPPFRLNVANAAINADDTSPPELTAGSFCGTLIDLPCGLYPRRSGS